MELNVLARDLGLMLLTREEALAEALPDIRVRVGGTTICGWEALKALNPAAWEEETEEVLERHYVRGNGGYISDADLPIWYRLSAEAPKFGSVEEYLDSLTPDRAWQICHPDYAGAAGEAEFNSVIDLQGSTGAYRVGLHPSVPVTGIELPVLLSALHKKVDELLKERLFGDER